MTPCSHIAFMVKHLDVPDNTDPASFNLRLSVDEAHHFRFLLENRVKHHTEITFQNMLARGVQRKHLIDLAKMLESEHLEKVAECFEKPIFPVTGTDLIQNGVRPGPSMGALLKSMFDTWEASRFQIDKQDLFKRVL